MSERITFTPFMSEANSAKAKHGVELHNGLFSLLMEEENEGRISCFRHKYTIGRAGFAKKQFYAPFMIQFDDGERWLVYSTPTLRDRIKIDQWDAFNIKQIDSHVVKAYLAYPPTVKEKNLKAFVAKDAKYRNAEEYSALDGLVDWDRLRELIHEKFDSLYAALYAPAKRGHNALADGKFYDYVGRAFERDVATVLSRVDFLNALKAGKSLPGHQFDHFKRMLTSFGLDAAKIASIKATANHKDIGDLPSGGAPKTDVIMQATLEDGSKALRTISCKRVTGDSVTAHQYNADEYARVLDPANETLRLHLNYFQMAGNFRDMPVGAADELTKLMAPQVKKLCYWAVGGNGGEGEEKQKAQYVVSYRPVDNAFSVHSVDEYVNWLLTACSLKKGGTPFSWTYQGKRGTNIQLKMPVMP